MEASRDIATIAGSLPPDLAAELHLGTAAEVEVIDVTHDSRQVGPGWMFACVVGASVDGHTFAAAAVEAGATALLVERLLPLDVAQVVVPDVRRAMGAVAAEVHGRPATKLRTIGITGTNGKTTTSHFVAAILRDGGLETRVQGTLSGARTTPEATDLQRLLAGYVADGVDAVVMEVSSHALALHRVTGVRFDVATFTNLGRDHLDLHGSMEAYFRAKASLFTSRQSERGVTNVDDVYGRLLLDAATVDRELVDVTMVGYGSADAGNVQVGADRLSFDWRGRRVEVPMGGRFNVMNALAALTTADVFGIDPDAAVAGIATTPPVPGRFEQVTTGGRHPLSVVVDYAHTPDGLVEVLTAARAVAGGGAVTVVFGCGGDRDTEKRPLMGAAAAQHADRVIVTSDNPRHEDPQAIIDATVSGIEQRYRDAVRIEPDRRRAIELAIRAAHPGDVIVIAGKGHETTQTIGDTALPFDDRLVAREVLAGLETPNETGEHE